MRVFGVLCTPARQRELAGVFCTLPAGAARAVVFTLQGLNAAARTVTGFVTGGVGEEQKQADEGLVSAPVWAEVPLPGLNINLSVQTLRAEVRELRALSKTEGVTLLNPANRLDQAAVLQMLQTGGPAPGLTPFLLPRPQDAAALERLPGFLLRPAAGCGLAGAVLASKRQDGGFDVYNLENVPYARVYDLEAALAPLFSRGRWVLQEMPEPRLRRGLPVGERVYLLRGQEGFYVVGRLPLPGTARAAPQQTLADDACASLCGRAGNFLPGLVVCYCDTTFTRRGTPVFCGLGGWDASLARTKKGRALQQKLCKGLQSYAAARLEVGP